MVLKLKFLSYKRSGITKLMGVELECEKKTGCLTGELSNHFFLTHFNFCRKNNDVGKTPIPDALREIDTIFAGNKADKLTYHSCDLRTVFREFWIAFSSLAGRQCLQVKKAFLKSDERYVILNCNSVKAFFYAFLTFSFSSL